MRLAIVSVAMVIGTMGCALAEPVRLDCARQVRGDELVVYIDLDRQTMRVESSYLGLRDHEDLRVERFTESEIAAQGGPSDEVVRHVLNLRSGVYTQTPLDAQVHSGEPGAVFSCQRGATAL